MILAAQVIHWGAWKFTGNYTTIDLIAASTNALNGALLARRPDHYRNFTRTGILLMALLGGLGGGVTRDILLNKVPSALTNPAYLTLCIVFGIVGYLIAFGKGQLFREGLFQFLTAFSLPWYAIMGASAAVTAHMPALGALLLAVVGATAGRYYIDITSGVPPKQFIRGEYFVATAILTAVVWLLCYDAGLGVWGSVGIAFAIGFTFRLLALFLGWEEPLAHEPKGAYIHSDGRPLLGRKLAGKSQRELRDIGLLPEPEPADPPLSSGT
jgi:uncharacterized membrane protein YeiH